MGKSRKGGSRVSGPVVTFFRSSSYNTWDFCPHKWYLSFGLGMREPSGFKAVKGNIVHKALELLARRKLAEQRKEQIVVEAETKAKVPIGLITPDKALRIAFEYYKKVETAHTFAEKDYRECWKWLKNGLEFNDGIYSPLNREVVEPEQYFDLTIEEPWAEYNYVLPDGRKLKGHLGLKGTIDLLTRHRVGCLEYLDWKTGKVFDWASGKEKNEKNLYEDPQLRMYHYALSRLYPKEKEIFVTIFFVQFLKPFSICFTRADLKDTEQMLRKRFEVIRATTRPARIINNRAHKWKCEKLCAFGKNKHPESDLTICEHTHRELLTVGMDKVNAKYMNVPAVVEYGAGGGRGDRPVKSAA